MARDSRRPGSPGWSREAWVGSSSTGCRGPIGLATVAVVYVGLIHVSAPNGAGGLRAFAGDPKDELARRSTKESTVPNSDGL